MIKNLSLEISSHCQLNCEYCARRIMTRTPGNMTLETAQKVRDELDSIVYALEYLVFNCWGEPTLNKDLFKIIDLFAGEARTVLSTNCVEYFPKLTDCGLDELILHINTTKGVRKENAIKYMQSPQELDLMYALMVVTPSVQDRVEDFIETYKPYTSENVKLFLKYPIVDEIADTYRPIRDDLHKFACDEVLVAGEPHMPRKNYCQGLETVTVLDDGTLMLECCRVDPELGIGHIDEGLVKSFVSPKASYWRDNFPDVGPCKECKNGTNDTPRNRRHKLDIQQTCELR